MGEPPLERTPGFRQPPGTVALFGTVLSILLSLPVAPVSGAGSRSPVKAQLLADVGMVRPGDAFTIGVRFHMEPGWHIYWKNPGDSGLPTSVKFILPNGFQVGPVRWPVPARFTQPGNIVGYGYTESVLLSARVAVPTDAPLGSTVIIRAEAAWLSCHKVCIPGHTKLDLKLPLGPSITKANSGLFAAWKTRLPVDVRSPLSPAVASVNGEIPLESSSGRFTVQLQWKSVPARVEWIPAADEAVKISNVKSRTKGTRTTITFTVAVLPGLRLSSELLETIVIYANERGNRKGVKVPIWLRGLEYRPSELSQGRSIGNAAWNGSLSYICFCKGGVYDTQGMFGNNAHFVDGNGVSVKDGRWGE